MTKEIKQQKMLECKAAAYDSICKLRHEIDSHRNFHRLVEHVMQGVRDFSKQLDLAVNTASEQFPCMCNDTQCEACEGKCNREASCQVMLATEINGEPFADQDVLVCDLCANSALHRGIARIIEESCSEIEQDL